MVKLYNYILDKIIIDNKLYEHKSHKSMYGNGIVIRHQPDGELLAYLKSPTFDKSDALEVINKVFDGSENFSIESVFTEPNHSSFENTIMIFPKGKPKKSKPTSYDDSHDGEYI